MQLQLQHINEAPCCHCGAEITSIQICERHCNGEWNEYVVFVCGRRLRYCPNFRKIEEERPCQNTKEFKDKLAKREIASKALIKAIGRLDADVEFKTKILENMKYSFGVPEEIQAAIAELKNTGNKKGKRNGKTKS